MIIEMYVYSRTGGSIAVAEAVMQAAELSGHAVELVRLKPGNENDPDPDTIHLPDLADASLSDLVIIGGPVHSFAADPVIRAAIRQIPGLDRKRVVLFATDTSPLDPFGGKRALSQMGEELQARSCRLMHSAVIYWNKKTRDSQIEELKHALKKIYG